MMKKQFLIGLRLGRAGRSGVVLQTKESNVIQTRTPNGDYSNRHGKYGNHQTRTAPASDETRTFKNNPRVQGGGDDAMKSHCEGLFAERR